MSFSNLVVQRNNGATIASIQWSIKHQLGSSRSYRVQINQYVVNKAKGKELGLIIRQAVIDGSASDAIDAINQYDDRIRFTNTYDFFDRVFGVNTVHCEHCDELVYEDDTRTVDGEGYYCQRCLDTHYYWSDAQDRYVSEENRDDAVIGSYHSSKQRLTKIPSSFDDRKEGVFIGMELEIEIAKGDREERAEHLLDQIKIYQDDKTGNGYTYALCESDGSLNHGFEMVTGWTGLDVHEKQLSFFKERFVGAKSHDTKTCGLHVHISKGDMSLLHATKMVEFINDPSNKSLILALARRDSSRWCAILDKKSNKSWKKTAVAITKGGNGSAQMKEANKKRAICALNPSRYEAINFHNPSTIEFRLFKGTLRYQTIMACLQFSYAVYQFCKTQSAKKLTTEEFLQFICKPRNLKDTFYLREYLDQKGITRADGLTLGAFSLVAVDSQKEVA